ncbi:MAG: SirB2 family protein [Casimicrobiaceae bacterium]
MGLPYATVKDVHVAAAALTACLFLLRAYWMAWRPESLARRWVRLVPHVVDTLLLVSGVWIALELGTAGVRGWLPAKLIALVAYIVLGTVALKRGRTRGIRMGAALAAALVLAYIACVAGTKSAWGPLAGWA